MFTFNFLGFPGWPVLVCIFFLFGQPVQALAPTLFYPPDGGYLKDDQPLFAWEGGSGTLELSRDGYFNPPDYSFKAAGKFYSQEAWFSFQIPRPLPDGRYFWRVRQKDGSSAAFAFTLDSTPLDFILDEKYWSGPAPPYQALADKERIDLIYLSDSTPQVYWVTTPDSGLSWSRPVNLSRFPFSSSAPRLTGSGGTAWAGWLVATGSSSRIGLTAKTTGEKNWRPVNYYRPTGQAIADFSLAAGRLFETSALSGLLLAYTAEITGGRTAVYLTAAGGSALTWSPPRLMGEPDQGSHSPALVSDGTAFYLFWISRTAEGNEDIFWASSTDPASAWSRSRSLPSANEKPAAAARALRRRIPYFQVAQKERIFEVIWLELAAFSEQQVKHLVWDRAAEKAGPVNLLATKSDVISSSHNFNPVSSAEQSRPDLLSPPRWPALHLGSQQRLVAWQQIDTSLVPQIYFRRAGRPGIDPDWAASRIISWPDFSGAYCPVFVAGPKPYLIWTSQKSDRLALSLIDLARWPF